MLAKAIWNGVVVAESADTVVVEGNHYFPPDSVDRGYLRESKTSSHCPWKGQGHRKNDQRSSLSL